MDHKRGYGTSVDQGQESTRVKRHKDLSYSQPSTALTSTQNDESSALPVALNRHNVRHDHRPSALASISWILLLFLKIVDRSNTLCSKRISLQNQHQDTIQSCQQN